MPTVKKKKHLFYLFILLYNIVLVFAVHGHESATGMHVFPILNPPPTSLPIPSLWVVPVHQSRSTLYHASNLDWRFVSRMIFYMFQCYSSHIILPSPSPTESKRLLYTSLSLLLSHIQGYCYHLSKFHIYALVYCIGVILCLTSLCIIGSSFIHFIRTDSNVFFLMAE